MLGCRDRKSLADKSRMNTGGTGQGTGKDGKQVRMWVWAASPSLMEKDSIMV